MKHLFFVLAVFFFLDTPAAQKPKYFPLKKGNQWEYTTSAYKRITNGDSSDRLPLVPSDTLNFIVGDTVTIQGQKYFAIKNKSNRVVQFVGFDTVTGYYYSRVIQKDGAYSSPKLFMKNSVKPNTYWYSRKIVYRVTSLAADTVINTVHYKNVVEVHELIPEGKKSIIRIKHWYAENIGEIATYISYPFSNTTGDLKLELSAYPSAR